MDNEFETEKQQEEIINNTFSTTEKFVDDVLTPKMGLMERIKFLITSPTKLFQNIIETKGMTDAFIFVIIVAIFSGIVTLLLFDKIMDLSYLKMSQMYGSDYSNTIRTASEQLPNAKNIMLINKILLIPGIVLAGCFMALVSALINKLIGKVSSINVTISKAFTCSLYIYAGQTILQTVDTAISTMLGLSTGLFTLSTIINNAQSPLFDFFVSISFYGVWSWFLTYCMFKAFADKENSKPKLAVTITIVLGLLISLIGSVLTYTITSTSIANM